MYRFDVTQLCIFWIIWDLIEKSRPVREGCDTNCVHNAQDTRAGMHRGNSHVAWRRVLDEHTSVARRFTLVQRGGHSLMCVDRIGSRLSSRSPRDFHITAARKTYLCLVAYLSSDHTMTISNEFLSFRIINLIIRNHRVIIFFNQLNYFVRHQRLMTLNWRG